MCLHLRSGDKETIAKEDIVCYKIAKRITYKNHPSGKDPDPVVMTPFCGAIITEDMIKDGDPLTPKRRTAFQTWQDRNYPNDRNAGWIHVLSDKNEAVDILKRERKMNKDVPDIPAFRHTEWILFECFIPKGTRYAAGISIWGDSYAAKKIIFKKEIKVK